MKQFIARWPLLAMLVALIMAMFVPGSLLAFDGGGCPVLRMADGAKQNCGTCHHDSGVNSIQGDQEGQFSAAVNQGGGALLIYEIVTLTNPSGHFVLIPTAALGLVNSGNDVAHPIHTAAPESTQIFLLVQRLYLPLDAQPAQARGGLIVYSSATQANSGTLFISPGQTEGATLLSAISTHILTTA